MGKGTSIGLHTFVPSKKPWLPGFVYVASFWVSLEDQLHHYGYFGAFKAVKGGRGGGGGNICPACVIYYIICIWRRCIPKSPHCTIDGCERSCSKLKLILSYIDGTRNLALATLLY